MTERRVYIILLNDGYDGRAWDEKVLSIEPTEPTPSAAARTNEGEMVKALIPESPASNKMIIAKASTCTANAFRKNNGTPQDTGEAADD